MSTEPSGLFFMLGGLILCVVGAAFCFAGYRLAKTLLVLLGFMIGAAVTAAVSHVLLGFDQWISLGIGLLGGILGALLVAFFYVVGVFVLGAVFGASLTSLSPPGIPIEPWIIMVFLGLVGGVLALLLQKFLIITGSAALGSWGIIAGIAAVLGLIDVTEFYRNPVGGTYLLTQHTWLKILWLLLALIGIAVQFRPGHAKVKEKEAD